MIHNLAAGKKTGVYHVEILERRRSRPSWELKRLAAHMAVSEAALRASVRRPLRSGRVYPEQFDEVFREGSATLLAIWTLVPIYLVALAAPA